MLEELVSNAFKFLFRSKNLQIKSAKPFQFKTSSLKLLLKFCRGTLLSPHILRILFLYRYKIIMFSNFLLFDYDFNTIPFLKNKYKYSIISSLVIQQTHTHLLYIFRGTQSFIYAFCHKRDFHITLAQMMKLHCKVYHSHYNLMVIYPVNPKSTRIASGNFCQQQLPLARISPVYMSACQRHIYCVIWTLLTVMSD